ncbi:MAG: glucose-6-phosphate isomerase [Micrococcales bacterium]|nr:glucose-6-phosphate isomerase [Micrococcales bacterium]
MDSPVDATSTSAWAKLTRLADGFIPDLRGWFATDQDRVEHFTMKAGDLVVDMSKGLITENIMDALVDLANDVDLKDRRDAMFSGQPINVTERRAVLHTALRTPKDEHLIVDGTDVIAEVHEVLDRMCDFASRVRSGKWLGVDGQPINTVVNIGIGGSDLGPVMVYEALNPYVSRGIACRFISNVDPSDMWLKTHDLDPATTLFIVSSKTFTTIETMTNARLCRAWLIDELDARGLLDAEDEIAVAAAVAKHFVAVSTNLDGVAEFGIDRANAFGFWDWVGGRYSVSSSIGLSCLIAVGETRWREFLAGMHTMDEHFRRTPLHRNVPVLMGLMNIWYSNFLGAASHAVLPYQQALHRFPAYLQQLTMESNGKRVRWDGSPVTSETGEIFWGEPGTNGQHAFYQLIHQGTRLVPADFIGVANPAHPMHEDKTDVHGLYMSNFFAQTAALAFGKTSAEARAETPKSSLGKRATEALVAARTFPGNRPTTSILAPALTPSVLGQLIALYEHITFTEGVIWGIDSFDQWGVELGKKLALEIAPAVDGDESALAAQDASTRSLIQKYRAMRKDAS